MLKAGIEVTSKISTKKFNVNELVRDTRDSDLRQKLLGEFLNQYQKNWLNSDLGVKYTGGHDSKRLICPRCKLCEFVRRGSRKRQLKSSIGLITFKLFQVSCVHCHKTFSPFMNYLGISLRKRITEELEAQLIYLVKDLSYHEASRKIEQLCQVKVSGFSIHRMIQRKAEEISIADTPKVTAMMIDATKVIVNKKIKHEELKVIMGVTGRLKQGNRYLYEKRIIGLACEQSWYAIQKEALKSNPDYIMCDGDNSIEKMTRRVFKNSIKQWCLWHIPRSVYYRTLWKDRLPWEERLPWIEQLKLILFDQTTHLTTVKSKLKNYIALLREAGLYETARYLEAHQKYYFNYRTQIQKRIQFKFKDTKPLVTTAVIERFMREIKRRSEIGVRWTSKGLVNLLKIKLISEYNKEQFQKMWNFSIQGTCSISLNVNIT